jgi:hypothetical protein
MLTRTKRSALTEIQRLRKDRDALLAALKVAVSLLEQDEGPRSLPGWSVGDFQELIKRVEGAAGS